MAYEYLPNMFNAAALLVYKFINNSSFSLFTTSNLSKILLHTINAYLGFWP